MHQLKIFGLCVIGFMFVSGNHTKDVREIKVNTADFMALCNQSFPIKMEYLHDLNTTGSFSDESEKGPMCFIHCYLAKTGVMGEGNQINSEKAALMYELDDEEMVDDCKNEMGATISDSCEKAYFFLRCLITRTMIDSKKRDEEMTV